MKRPVGSLFVAFVIVTGSMAGALALRQPTAEWPWPKIAAPLIPAYYFVYVVIMGGPHGRSLQPYQEAAATFAVALVMWWLLAEGCRLLWNRIRHRTNAIAPRRRSHASHIGRGPRR